MTASAKDSTPFFNKPNSDSAFAILPKSMSVLRLSRQGSEEKAPEAIDDRMAI